MLPLRWKLVLLYALVLSAVIGAFSVALAVGLGRTLVRGLDTELEQRAKALGAVLELDKNRWVLDPKSGFEREYAQDVAAYYTVSSEKGERVLASPLARGRVPGEVGPPRDVRLGDRHFREAVVIVDHPADPEDGTPPARFHVACGKDLAPVDLAVGSLVGQLAVLGPAILVVSLAGGLFLAGRALRPIEQMARTASEISAKDLTRRLEVRGRDELAHLGRTLNDTFDRLRESFERQTRFIADASHELRTPLAVVAGNVELALKRPRSADELRELVSEIQDGVRRMQSVVEGLLTLARADAKSVQMRRERVSLTTLCDEAARMLRPLADQHHVKVTVESQGDVASTGDPERLRELISNLVTNAIRYNRKGGKVQVGLSREGGRALLTVDDTGIGIPAEDLPHLFERFYRVDKARSRDVPGTGLGLAIAKWIVEAHAGEIRVQSRLGEGSRFIVSLPA